MTIITNDPAVIAALKAHDNKIAAAKMRLLAAPSLALKIEAKREVKRLEGETLAIVRQA